MTTQVLESSGGAQWSDLGKRMRGTGLWGLTGLAEGNGCSRSQWLSSLVCLVKCVGWKGVGETLSDGTVGNHRSQLRPGRCRVHKPGRWRVLLIFVLN